MNEPIPLHYRTQAKPERSYSPLGLVSIGFDLLVVLGFLGLLANRGRRLPLLTESRESIMLALFLCGFFAFCAGIGGLIRRDHKSLCVVGVISAWFLMGLVLVAK